MLSYALVGRFGACMVNKNLKQIVLYRYIEKKKKKACWYIVKTNQHCMFGKKKNNNNNASFPQREKKNLSKLFYPGEIIYTSLTSSVCENIKIMT